MESDEDDIEQFMDRNGYLSDDEDGGVNEWEGQRKGRIFQGGEYYYRLEKKVPSTGMSYFHCREKDLYKCKARAKRSGHGPLEATGRAHNHPGNPDYGEFLRQSQILVDQMLNQKDCSMTKTFKRFIEK